MMTVTTCINVYEVDGQKTEGASLPVLRVLSHWNDRDRVVIETLSGVKLTVIGSDLVMAIENARNKR